MTEAWAERSEHKGSEPSLSILYVGANNGTSLHRAHGLRRLGHSVRILDPEQYLPKGHLPLSWIHHTGALGFGSLIRKRVNAEIGTVRFDILWVDGGSFVSPELLGDLKAHARSIINYNLDDPFGKRDSNKWRLYLRSVPEYDLVVVVRDCNVAEARNLGAKEVMRVHRSADEVAHAPRQISPDDRTRWASEIAFIGTWMPERGPFLARLIQQGVPVSIWGDRWAKAEDIRVLRPHWRGPGLYNDQDYGMAIQCAKVCLGMLSKGNRDLCTQRTFEIPHLGGLLCAERTFEHKSLYEEDAEAVFWSDADECAAKCHELLRDEARRLQVARNGQLRSIKNRTTNQYVLKQILSRMTARLEPELVRVSLGCQP
jgi:spore maturation protein CgeB